MALAAAILASCHEPETASAGADPVISAAVAGVDIDSVRTYIDELVTFHTRHTLSSQTDPQKGIGAAVDYLAGRCERWARNAAPDRPQPLVERISYTVGENGGRYDRVTEVPELMVTLPGTRAEREILLMAHIDTRVLDVMDSTKFAPGADDDSSGQRAECPAAIHSRRARNRQTAADGQPGRDEQTQPPARAEEPPPHRRQ